ncbi:MAG: hypothetical protein R3Y64_10680 [Peptostreptococcaceae bacterium]
MKYENSLLYIQNYHALLACILNENLTPGEAIERLINPKQFGEISSYMKSRKNKNKKAKSYVVEDTLKNKKFNFDDRQKMIDFLEPKDKAKRKTVINAMYENKKYKGRYLIIRKY